ncbi:MAG: site-specific integrase [Candidatus Hydrogenedentes bacterium]|nr:site-specific integrase [Candidatus Hydrogenedentota bacterium]
MLTLSRRGGVWHFRLTLSSGLDVRRSTGQGDKAAAELAALRIISDMDLDGMRRSRVAETVPAPVYDLDMLAARFLEWARGRHAPATLATEGIYLRTLSQYTGGMLSGSLDVERFIEWRLASGAVAVTVNMELRTLRAALNHMARLGWIPCNPFAKVKLLRAPASTRRALSGEELRAILDTAKTHGHDIDLAAHLAGLAGLRAGEVAACRWTWIDWEGGVLKIPCDSTFTPKGKRPRVIPLHPELLDCLMRHKKDLGRVLQGKEVPRGAWASVCARAGVRCLVHELRHSCITLWTMAGVPVPLVQAWAGHSSIVTTQGYLHAAGHVDARHAFTLPDTPAQQERASS